MLAGDVQRPQANPAMLDQSAAAGQRYRGPGRGIQNDEKLVAFLKANHADERFLMATLSARQAAPVIIQTGQPVAALGGFSGADPIVSPDRLDGMVEAGQLRFVMVGGLRGFGAFQAAQERQAALSDWVKDHGTPVDPALWRAPQQANRPDAQRARRRFGVVRANATPIELYDLKPAAGEKPPLTE
jgi:4-amino-4-deoxy-L-arabinose transferase-like glycosyltransferase